MRLNCYLCGRPLADVDLEPITGPQANIVGRFFSGFGLELPQLETLLNPTPETVATTFNVRCPLACRAADAPRAIAAEAGHHG